MSGPHSSPRHAAGPRALRVHLDVDDGELARYLAMALAGGAEWNVVPTAATADVLVADADSPAAPSAAADLPVLFLGGSREARARLRSSRAARVAFLAKPFNAAQLRAALLQLVQRAD